MNKHIHSSEPNTFMLDEDDKPIGRVLGRREVLSLLGTAGSALVLSACAPFGSPTAANLSTIEDVNASLPAGCVVRPELTEGPLFVDDDLNRSDIRTDPSNGVASDGVPLDLTIRVSNLLNGACSSLANAQVDIWQCDAVGVYSDTDQLGMDTVGQKFLRGFQMTDADGLARFTTIYPGWYRGRAVHIHFKIRTTDGYDFTSQLFFDEAQNDKVMALAPYNNRSNDQRLRNNDDGIFNESGGQLMLTTEENDAGFAGVFDIALDLG